MHALCFRLATVIIMVTFIIMPASLPAANDHPRLKVEIQDRYLLPDDSLFYLDVILDTPLDSVAGFSLLFLLDRPDLIEFDTLISWPRGIDTSASLISDWELVASNFPSGVTNANLKIVGIADMPSGQPTLPVLPQTGGRLLRLVLRLADPLPLAPDSAVSILIDESLNQTGFSDPIGNLIGIITELEVDTTWYKCTKWIGDSCGEWTESAPHEADSMFVDSNLYSYYDTTDVVFDYGYIQVSEFYPGDANGDLSVNLGDAGYIINYIFNDGNPPEPLESGDANCDLAVNLADAGFIINYIFNGGPLPGCLHTE